MRRRVDLALCTFALVLACGDATGASTENSSETSAAATDVTEAASTDGATGAGETSTSDTPTSASTDTTTTSTTDATTEPSTGEPPLTTDATTASTTGTTASTTGTTGAPAQPDTRAWWVDGNSLQIRVVQQDVEAGLCRGFFLEALANGGVDDPKYEPVEQPAEWGVRVVFVHQDLDDCFDPYLFFRKDPAHAESATGTVTFHDVDPLGRPASLDLEITGTYLPAAPWIPAEDLLAATAVAVETG